MTKLSVVHDNMYYVHMVHPLVPSFNLVMLHF